MAPEIDIPSAPFSLNHCSRAESRSLYVDVLGLFRFESADLSSQSLMKFHKSYFQKQHSHFEPWSDDEGDCSFGTPSPAFLTTPAGGPMTRPSKGSNRG
ncbi:hypothetical protein AVEN_170329-1 [Araneus ventricosus]|uniref:Uncharacterized protein n=1 Tax=Araneus ventricosus TaxID=182803 RepID=A0A4Y2CD68_ARAVE|nr:hypothetical protein AVEN_170329-1 [Araneus ventricosus]